MTAQPAPLPIDWPAVLDDLAHLLGDVHPDNPDCREPCSQRQLADALGVARGTLRGWIDGSDPKHSDGERMLCLWAKLTGKDLRFAPRARRPLKASAR